MRNLCYHFLSCLLQFTFLPKWWDFDTTVLKGAFKKKPSMSWIRICVSLGKGVPDHCLCCSHEVKATVSGCGTSRDAQSRGRPPHLPACHRGACPDGPRCSARTSACGGPSSPPRHRPRAAGSPSSGLRCRDACTVTRRFPATGTLVAQH